MTLQALYARLQEAIMGGDVQAATLIRPHGELSPQQRLAIYSDGYRIRLRAAVADDYACLAYMLGETLFAPLLDDYLREVPSVFFNLDRYSIGFGAFAAGRCDDRFALEIALLESAINDVYLRAEMPALRPESLTELPPDALSGLRLTLRESCVLMQTNYPVNRFLSEFRDGKKPARPAEQTFWLAVVRHESSVRRLELAQDEYRMLQILAEGHSFGASCEQTARELSLSDEAFAPLLQEWFARWLENGLLQDGLSAASSS